LSSKYKNTAQQSEIHPSAREEEIRRSESESTSSGLKTPKRS